MAFPRFASVAAFSLAACSHAASSTPAPDASTTPPNDFQASIGPIDLPAGAETTRCIVVPFGNDDDRIVTGFDANLAPGSHHLIVYLTSDEVQTDPIGCVPFAGIAAGTDAPLLFVNKEQASYTFPSGIAQEVPANQNIRIEAHYINSTGADLSGHGEVTFHSLPKVTAPPYQPTSFMFWGTTNISIPPNASFSTGPLFQAGLAGTHFILITTHQHELGTGAQVWASAKSGDLSNQIANDTDWANPSWRELAPQLDFNGTNGLSYQCSWTNSTSKTVGFGESALDEMCFIGGYFYPATHLDLCIDGRCPRR